MNVLLEVVPGSDRTFPSGYNVSQAAKLLDLPVSRIREFVKAESIHPRRGPRGEYRFSFQDIVLLRTARELLDQNIPTRRVRESLEALREQLPVGRPLSAVQVSALGDKVLVADPRHIVLTTVQAVGAEADVADPQLGFAFELGEGRLEGEKDP